MYAMRSVGRSIARAAKTRAPVYKGDDPRAQAESGNLRKSIRNNRRIKNIAGIYEMYVGPFGSKKAGTAVVRYNSHGITAGHARATGHNAARVEAGGFSTQGQVRGVPLYRRKIEEKTGFMRTGFAVGTADMHAIYEEAYAKAFAKYR
jgi:hypothetical protein